MNKVVSSKEIIELLKNKNLYQKDNGIKNIANSVSDLKNNRPNSICWIKHSNYNLSLLQSSIILAPIDFKDVSNNKTIIYTKNPKLAMIYVINEFFLNKIKPSISKKASIGKNVKIGENVYIGDNVVIYDNCIIGDNSYIYPNCVIYSNTIIGSYVVINAGVKIGQEGFGYVKDLNGKNIQFPHIGKVIVKDYVEIGANTCIDKGALSNTVIGEYTKINNLVHIAHNVTIGKNCLICAKVEISGSVMIKDNVYIAPNATIIDGITIEDEAVIGLGAVIRKNVKKGAVMVPFEAMDKKDYILIRKNIRRKYSD